MADNQKSFDLEKLKTDPGLWKRLATPFEGSDKMGNVFLEKENPFIAASAAAAMEKVRKLAEEGKLYVREFGRSRHFQKVEKDGEHVKLGEQVDAKTAGPYDPALGLLHRLSQRYFRRFGMEKIANWFGKRVEKYDAYLELDKQYKREYDSMSKAQKEQLKALRKREKKENSLQEKEKSLQEELEKVQKELSDLKKDKAPNPEQEQLDPEQEQPNPEQEQPKQEQEQAQREQIPRPEQELQQEQQLQTPGGPFARDPEQIIRDGDAIYIGGVKITGEVKNLDPELLRDLVAQIKAQTQEQQRREEPDIQEPPLDQEALNNAARVPGENNPEKVAAQQDTSGFWLFDDDPQPEDHSELIPDDDSLVEDHIDLIRFDDEPQPKPEEPVPATLQARLAQERDRLDNITAWANGLTKAMMDNETNRVVYENITEHGTFSADETRALLIGTVSALFGTKEGRQQGGQLLESVINGQLPKEPAFESQVQQGIQVFDRAWEQLEKGDGKPMGKLMSDSIRELSRSAAERTNLSERNILIGRLISETFRLAQDKPGIKLNLNDEELAAAKGALTMSVVEEKNLRARQLLGGKENLDIRDPQTVTAVRDILMAKGVESCMYSDPPEEGKVSNTQLLMGTDVLSLSNLELMTNGSQPRQNITTEQIKELMNNPQGIRAMKAGMQVAKKFARDAIQKADRELNPPEHELQMQARNPMVN